MSISAPTLFATSSRPGSHRRPAAAGCVLAGTSVKKPAAQRKHVLALVDRLVDLIALLLAAFRARE